MNWGGSETCKDIIGMGVRKGGTHSNLTRVKDEMITKQVIIFRGIR